MPKLFPVTCGLLLKRWKESNTDQEGHVQLLLPHCYLMSGRSQEDLDSIVKGNFSMVSPENSVAISIVVNAAVPGHAS